MSKTKGKGPQKLDANQWAAQTVAAVTGLESPTGVLEAFRKRQAERRAMEAQAVKNPAAVALGKLGGSKGGKARAASLTAKKRKEIAQKAAKARWKKKPISDEDLRKQLSFALDAGKMSLEQIEAAMKDNFSAVPDASWADIKAKLDRNIGINRKKKLQE